MSWSYDPSNSTDRDLVRLKIGDTNSADPIFSNEEIDASLVRQSNSVLASAIELCGAAIAKYSRQPTGWSNESLSISYAEWANTWRALRADLVAEQSASSGAATMLVGGLTVSGNDTLDRDDSKIQPWARTGIDMRGRPWR